VEGVPGVRCGGGVVMSMYMGGVVLIVIESPLLEARYCGLWLGVRLFCECKLAACALSSILVISPRPPMSSLTLIPKNAKRVDCWVGWPDKQGILQLPAQAQFVE
jgi:hypothetical protein